MKKYLLEYLLFLNLSGRFANLDDFSISELRYLQNFKNINVNSNRICFKSFTDLRDVNFFAEDRLYKLLKKTLKILGYIPGIKQVAVCNSFSFRNQNLNSDLDLFLILDHKFFFTTRLLIVIVLSLFGLKRTKKKFINKVCLSFIISDKNLNLSRIKFQNDFYLSFWLENLVFLGNDLFLKNKFFRVNNAFEFNHNFFNKISKPRLKINSFSYPRFLFKPLFVFEKFNKFFQLRRCISKYNSLNKPYGIYIRDGFLKFHNEDIRVEFNKRYSILSKAIFSNLDES